MYPRIYTRRLPHFHPPNVPIFFTWRLFGSIPRTRMIELKQARVISFRNEFRTVERILDRSDRGPRFLSDPRIARIVCECIELGASSFERYLLHEYVVMPNHVHVLLTPIAEVPVITQSLKSVTAHAANKILRRTGSPFWQLESFDRWSRDPEQSSNIRRYIRRNPVKAGLAATPEEWPWSSAHRQIALSPIPL
jgi:REP element-mobilizing transposase RayT